MCTFNCWGPHVFIELLIMSGLVTNWAISWVVGGPGLGPGLLVQ